MNKEDGNQRCMIASAPETLAETLAFSSSNEYYTYEKPPQRMTVSLRLQRKVSDYDQVSSVSLATSLCEYYLASSRWLLVSNLPSAFGNLAFPLFWWHRPLKWQE